MKKLFNYIVKSINVLNIFLIVIIFLFFQYINKPKINFKLKSDVQKNIEQIEKKDEKKTKGQDPLILDYMIIAAENPFHPERIIPVEKKELPPPPKPELLLYGVTITDDFSIAYVEDKKTPLTTPGRGKRHTVLKKGDSIGGFILNEIHPDKIVLVRGEETLIVNLIDSTKPRDGAISPPPAQKPITPTPRPIRPPNIPQPIPEE